MRNVQERLGFEGERKENLKNIALISIIGNGCYYYFAVSNDRCHYETVVMPATRGLLYNGVMGNGPHKIHYITDVMLRNGHFLKTMLWAVFYHFIVNTPCVLLHGNSWKF